MFTFWKNIALAPTGQSDPVFFWIKKQNRKNRKQNRKREVLVRWAEQVGVKQLPNGYQMLVTCMISLTRYGRHLIILVCRFRTIDY
jgi:hypothetical protein